MSEEEVVLKPDRAFSAMGITDPELEEDIKAHMLRKAEASFVTMEVER